MKHVHYQVTGISFGNAKEAPGIFRMYQNHIVGHHARFGFERIDYLKDQGILPC